MLSFDDVCHAFGLFEAMRELLDAPAAAPPAVQASLAEAATPARTAAKPAFHLAARLASVARLNRQNCAEPEPVVSARGRRVPHPSQGWVLARMTPATARPTAQIIDLAKEKAARSRGQPQQSLRKIAGART
jgi:hypothetical protein